MLRPICTGRISTFSSRADDPDERALRARHHGLARNRDDVAQRHAFDACARMN